MDWLMAQFGTNRLHAEVVLPTDDYFPGAYRGIRVVQHMDRRSG